MNCRTLSVIAATTALVAISHAALAQDMSGTNASDAAPASSGPVAQLAMAQQLFAYGVANGDALSVLTAARITGSIDTKDVAREVETTANENAGTTDGGAGTDSPVTAAAMLATAKDLAGDNDAILGLVSDAETEGSRGRIGGASKTLSRLNGGYTDVFTVPFYGDSLAEIAIVGDGDSNLDVVVTDENGNTICLDRSYSDQVYCSFVPAWSGNFHIGVKNQGRIRNSYYLLTN